MPTTTLSIGACVRFGWDTFKSRPWFFVGATLVIIIADLVIRIIGSMLGGTHGNLLSFLITLVLGLILGMSVMTFALAAHDAPASVTLGRFIPDWSRLPSYAGTYILFIIIVIVGLILIIVPGVIASLAFGFCLYLVIDRGSGPIDALKESGRLTKGNRLNLFGLGIVLALINILGLICLVVGMLVSIPVTLLAMVHAYRVLANAPAAVAPPPAAPPMAPPPPGVPLTA